MSVVFTRTPTGLVAKWHFYSVPTIWVEGPTDIIVYEPIVRDLDCRIEAFHGAENAKALIDGLLQHDHPYTIIVDGDYSILRPCKTMHQRIITLQRYSCENYLWEQEPLNRCCHRHARSGDRNDIVGPELQRLAHHIETSLRELVELDVAARRSDPSPDVLPDRIDSLLVKSTAPVIDPAKVVKLKHVSEAVLDTKVIETARSDVAAFMTKNPFIHVLNGHILFGLLRLLFTQITTTLRGSKVVLGDDALLQLLSDAVWQRPASTEHQRVRRLIRKITRSLIPRLMPVSAPGS